MEMFPQGGILIFSYIRRLWPFFWVQNFEFQYFGGFSDKYFFGEYDDFVDIFLGSLQNWTSFKGHFYAIFFLRSRYRMGCFFFLGGGVLKFHFFGCLKFLIFFGVNGRCWARAYV